MCADAKMMRLLASEIRGELDKRKSRHGAGAGHRGWRAAACIAVACVTVLALA